MNMNKNSKNSKNSKSRRKTLRHTNITQKRRNYTQKNNQIGGTKQSVCEELPELKQNNILNIFKYDIQLPKITK
jgi:hypothetical protein